MYENVAAGPASGQEQMYEEQPIQDRKLEDHPQFKSVSVQTQH